MQLHRVRRCLVIDTIVRAPRVKLLDYDGSPESWAGNIPPARLAEKTSSPDYYALPYRAGRCRLVTTCRCIATCFTQRQWKQ